jgi:3-hydroxyacyl-CoA dehydrogenase
MKVAIVGAGNMGRGIRTRTVAGQQPLNLGFASAVKLHP